MTIQGVINLIVDARIAAQAVAQRGSTTPLSLRREVLDLRTEIANGSTLLLSFGMVRFTSRGGKVTITFDGKKYTAPMAIVFDEINRRAEVFHYHIEAVEVDLKP